ncbi:MAG: phospholipase D-like domain-containing protein [Alkalilacustris sp.]
MPEGTRQLIANPAPAGPDPVEIATSRLRSIVAGPEAARLGTTTRRGGRGPRAALLREAGASAAAVDGGRLPPVDAAPGQVSLDLPWRQAELRLPLESRPPLGAPIVQFPGAMAAETLVHLDAVDGTPLQVTGHCDGPVLPRDATGPGPATGSGRRFRLSVGPAARDGSALRLGSEVTRCDLQVRGSGPAHPLTLLREDLANPRMAALDSRLDICAVPPADSLDALERAVLSDRWLSRSCLAPPGAMRLMTDGLDAFNAKVEALTGSRLERAVLKAGDPEMPLDFRQAPELDLIVVSALQLRADFTGRLLGRMLAHHAARGTPVRIMVSHNLQTGPDWRLLARLSADWPAVQVQAFRWHAPEGLTPATLPDRVQRGHHAKAFGTLARDPARSRFMVGGRNLHDGFLFDSPRDLSGHPGLHDYTSLLRSPLAYFAAYEDLELEISDHDTVRAMMAHMGTLWHRDAPSAVTRPFSVAVEVPDAPREGVLHFLSVPQNDGRALERWLVELLDAAERRVDITSPYLNLTAALEDALTRALDRGVRVRVVIPEVMRGDPVGGFKVALKQDFLRRFGDRVALYEVSDEVRMLHSKFLIFDGRLSLVTSANLNARSLLHDTENGLAVLDPAFAARLEAVMEGYITRASREIAPVSPGPLDRLLLAWPRARSWF